MRGLRRIKHHQFLRRLRMERWYNYVPWRVKQFAEVVGQLAKEIACDGGESIASHRLSSRVEVYVEDVDIHDMYELVDVQASMLPGCGCWDGIRLVIRRVKEEGDDDRA